MSSTGGGDHTNASSAPSRVGRPATVAGVPDLFSAAAENLLRSQAPLAARLRPRTLDDVVGQTHLVGEGKPLRRLVEQDRLTSAIFWGPPGTGKTTLALAVAGSTKRAFEQMSAVSAGVKDVREVIERARQRLGELGRGTILFLDEIHRFSKAQQDALLPAVEDGTLTLIGATTENPFFEVNAPLRSRSTLFRLEPLAKPDIEILIARGLQAEGRTATPEAVAHLADRAGGDGRQVLTALEVAVALANPNEVTLEHVEQALGTSALRYGRDDHYDVVSAFIKSMRGSDPQAAVYYLARMLEAGEDARFIARRMIIFASEDVGMADPTALQVAVAAAHALEHVGLPEAQLNLSQTAIHLATAPKSNRAALAIWNARSDVQAGAVGEVPAHLRDAHYQGAKSLGHGVDYDYPHDHPDGWIEQQYLPTEQADKRYYEPTQHGAEAAVAERMEKRQP
ncbi:MAG: replication-associated recombination protein A [Actinomycetia bacterium]|nr:replication-associated recombination protein A [Actinomycetes bacterium]